MCACVILLYYISKYIYIYIIYVISTHAVVRIGFTANSSVVTSNGETTFTIGILSGQLQFGASVRVMLTAVGPIKDLYIIKSVKKNYMYKGIEINIHLKSILPIT